MITPTDRGRSSFPNLIGNAPDWDAIRAIADAHGLPVIEDSCDTLGATLRGTPTGSRSDISVTSFANSHIITCAGNGGMVMLDDDGAARPGADAAPLGPPLGDRTSSGSQAASRDFWEDLDGIHYDNQFIFDELGVELRAVRDGRRVRPASS